MGKIIGIDPVSYTHLLTLYMTPYTRWQETKLATAEHSRGFLRDISANKTLKPCFCKVRRFI